MTGVWKILIGPLAALVSRWFDLDLPKFAVVAVCGLAIAMGILLGGASLCASLGPPSPERVALEDHESRLRVLERTTGEVASDVKWIRRILERHWAAPISREMGREESP